MCTGGATAQVRWTKVQQTSERSTTPVTRLLERTRANPQTAMQLVCNEARSRQRQHTVASVSPGGAAALTLGRLHAAPATLQCTPAQAHTNKHGKGAQLEAQLALSGALDSAALPCVLQCTPALLPSSPWLRQVAQVSFPEEQADIRNSAALLALPEHTGVRWVCTHFHTHPCAHTVRACALACAHRRAST